MAPPGERKQLGFPLLKTDIGSLKYSCFLTSHQ